VARKETPAIIGEGLKSESEAKNSDKVLNSLMDHSLNVACQQARITRQYLNNMPAGGRKRNVVDDISILVVDLKA